MLVYFNCFLLNRYILGTLTKGIFLIYIINEKELRVGNLFIIALLLKLFSLLFVYKVTTTNGEGMYDEVEKSCGCHDGLGNDNAISSMWHRGDLC